MVFECACGRRPFFHDDIYVEALSLVEKKSGNNIYITKKSDGEYVHTCTLCKCVCMCLWRCDSLSGVFSVYMPKYLILLNTRFACNLRMPDPPGATSLYVLML